MGVFTVYCFLCGGPAMDISSWVDDKQMQEGGFHFGGEDFSWLNDCIAITANGVVKGKCDDYGRLEGEDCDVCVLKGNWERANDANKKRRKRGSYDSDDDITNGVLAHSACWGMLQCRLDKKIPMKSLFHRVSGLISDYEQCIEGVEYGDIVQNQGQDYELNENEGHLVSNPQPACCVNLHSHDICPVGGELNCLPLDCLRLMLTYCDFNALGNLACTSQSASVATRHRDLYTHYVNAGLALEGENMLIFAHADQKTNHIRILDLVNHIVPKVNRTSLRKKKKTSSAV